MLFLFAGACSTGAVLPPVGRGPMATQDPAIHLGRAAVLQAWVNGLHGECESAEAHLSRASLVGVEREEIQRLVARIGQECRAVEVGDRGVPQGVEQ